MRTLRHVATLAISLGLGLAGGWTGCSSSQKASGFDNHPTPDSSGIPVTGDSGGLPGDSGGGGVLMGDGGGMGTGLDAGCATAMAKATKQPVYMMFVLDGSGSMTQDSKWVSVVPALNAIFADMATKMDTGVGAGLIVFSDSMDPTSNGFTEGPYPTNVDVPIAYVSASQKTALNTRLSGSPFGGTPTQAALGGPGTGGYGALESFSPKAPLQPGGKKVLILLTDGVPTDGCATSGMAGYNYAGNACMMTAAAELAKASPAGPILTFAIGVGIFPSTDLTNFDPAFLGNLAKSGGTAPAGCNPAENATVANVCYFEVNPSSNNQAMIQAQFENAINAIRGQVASCTFSLELSDAGAIDPTKVNVVVDGMTVPQDPNNGWTYDNPNNPTSVTLHGTSCANVKNTPNSTVSIVLGCATQTAH